MEIGDTVKVLYNTPYYIVRKNWRGIVIDIIDNDKIKVWSGRGPNIGFNHYIVQKKYFLPKSPKMLTYLIS